jgi:hypothetical protein
LATFRVKELWCATTNSRSPVFRQVLATARERSIPIRIMSGGDLVMLGDCLECQYHSDLHELWLCQSHPASNIPSGRSGLPVRLCGSFIKIGWDRTMLSQNVPKTRSTLHAPRATFQGRARPGQDAPDMVTIERHNPVGMPAIWRIRCVEPGKVMPGNNDADGVSWIGLAPGEGLRVDLDESDCRVEPLGNR